MAASYPSSQTSKSPTKQSRVFKPPTWLIQKAKENADKFGYPRNYLQQILGDYTDQQKSPETRTKDKRREKKLEVRHERARESHNEHDVNKTKQRTNLDSPGHQGDSESLFIRNNAADTDDYPVAAKPPEWYLAIKDTHYEMKVIGKRKPQALTALDALKNCIDICEKEQRLATLKKLYEDLRDHIHKAEITIRVTKYILKKTRIMSREYGLPRIFSSRSTSFPWDIKADTYQLYRRWYAGIFELDLLRGIIKAKDDERNSDRIDPAYRRQFGTSWRYYGQGDLVLGQWWPTQLCMVRDGAHGAAQGGISGEKQKGAYSIVLSGGSSYYDDEDNGDTIWYSGTHGKDCKPTENTIRMIETCDAIKNPVRVIRSHQLPKANLFRPVRGFRYDGLYDVASYKLIDKDKAAYKFRLVRHEGQHPIRCGNNAASRPTRFEIMEDEKLRKEGPTS